MRTGAIGAVVFWCVLAANGPGHAQIPEVCRADAGLGIEACPISCAAACDNLSFQRSTPEIRRQCDALRARGGMRPAAEEPAACRGWTIGSPLPRAAPIAAGPQIAPVAPPNPAGTSPAAGPTPAAAPLATSCEVLREPPGDWNFVNAALDALPDANDRAPMESYLSKMPPCVRAIGPAALALRLECVGTEADGLDAELRRIRRVRPPEGVSQAEVRRFCGEWEAVNREQNLFATLSTIESRAERTQKSFTADTQCLGQLQVWLQQSAERGQSSGDSPADAETGQPAQRAPNILRAIGRQRDFINRQLAAGQTHSNRVRAVLDGVRTEIDARHDVNFEYTNSCILPPGVVPQGAGDSGSVPRQ